MHGTASISKVVGSTFLSERRRQEMNERIKTAIETLNVQSVPAYRKLMEEIGLAYNGPAYPAQATSSSPLNGSSPVYEQRSSPHYQSRRGSSPRDQRSTGLAVPSTPHRQPWNTNPQNSAQYSQMPPPPPPPFLNYSPQYNQMQYPPTTPFSQFPYPSYNNNVSTRENGGGNRENGNVGGLSPILTHAPPPPLGSGGGGPFSPAGYPFSPGGDPYSALRINNHVGFNPQFSRVETLLL